MTSYPSLWPLIAIHLVGAVAVWYVVRWIRQGGLSFHPALVTVNQARHAMGRGPDPYRAVSVVGQLGVVGPGDAGGLLRVNDAGSHVRVLVGSGQLRRLYDQTGTSIDGEPAVVDGWIRYAWAGGYLVPWAIHVGDRRVTFNQWRVDAAVAAIILLAAASYLAFLTLIGFLPAAIPLGALVVWMVARVTAASNPRRPSRSSP